MLITNVKELADKVRSFSNLGYSMLSGEVGKGKITKDAIQDPVYERHVIVGWNYRMSDLCAAVALAQLERLEDFIDQRIIIAQMYAEAIKDCHWLVPQVVPKGCKHSYWTYTVKLEHTIEFSWYDFRKKYMELGGDGIYAAWLPNYLEPAFRGLSGIAQEYGVGLCPVAESVQPKLLQFKTNYMDIGLAKQQAEALTKTIGYFGK